MPPAGWYPDPANPSQRRYWNGAAWTDQVQVVPAPPILAAPTPTPNAQPAYVHQTSAGQKPVVRGKRKKSRRSLLWKIPAGFLVAFVALGILASFTPEEVKNQTVDSGQESIEAAPSVLWDDYAEDLKGRIDSFGSDSNCVALQEQFDISDGNNQATLNRTGHNNADLMAYIDWVMKNTGCYQAVSPTQITTTISQRYSTCLADLGVQGQWAFTPAYNDSSTNKLGEAMITAPGWVLTFSAGLGNTGDLLTFPADDETLEALESVGC